MGRDSIRTRLDILMYLQGLKWKSVRSQQSCRCILVLCLLINSARTEASDWNPPTGAQTIGWSCMCAAYVQLTQKPQNRVESAYSVAQYSSWSRLQMTQSSSQSQSGRLRARRGPNNFESMCMQRFLTYAICVTLTVGNASTSPGYAN